ncbi:hypothetical protein CAPTEDRAFT_183735 [Capitella teleta]|uniref:G-protein coupled receptors family 1 profile domain-containing protein n=1 Tax=Capitella teleta TaxID=283909 RepID=R7UFD3_CAPTE|nr:hypothetical protein CAPTEDRAFT_183735 [Capitella teleta]|eukprot:ELU01967.1 hypothetical protein CAPTEDRAFT_183735 [Capitella teleta]
MANHTATPIHNATESSKDSQTNVADADFDKSTRLIMLYVTVLIGMIGGVLVFVWLFYNRRRKSRVNALILHVALGDMLVICWACIFQIIWEHVDRQWMAGEVACRLLKWLQGIALMASNNLLVVLSIDRHQAIRAPLKQPFRVWKMALLGWSSAFVFSSPQLYIFHVHFVDDPESRFANHTLCEGIFRDMPEYHRQAYLTYVGVLTFYVPLVIIAVCYIRIFLKIAEKANQSTGQKKVEKKPGKLHLTSTTNTSLPKAKIKTLKMTVVIVSSFIICSLPYHILEMIYSFGSHDDVPKKVASILGAMAVANSATNPFVFLVFNVNWACLRGTFSSKRAYFDSLNSTRTDYANTTQTEVTRGTTIKYSGVHNNHINTRKNVGAIEMKVKTNADYLLVNNKAEGEK